MHETTDFNHRQFNKIALVLQVISGNTVAGRCWTELHALSELNSDKLILNLIRKEC